MNIKRVRRTRTEGRDNILSAAEQVLRNVDFAALTVDLLMKEAGMTRSAFYHYFSGLDDLALGLLERFEQDLHRTLTPWQEISTTGDLQAATISHLRAMFEVIDAHRTGVSAVAQAASANPMVYEAWQRRVLDYFFSQSETFIRQQIAAGRSGVTDPPRTARALTLMNHAALSDNFARPDPDSPAQLANTLGSIWNATIFTAPAGTDTGHAPTQEQMKL